MATLGEGSFVVLRRPVLGKAGGRTVRAFAGGPTAPLAAIAGPVRIAAVAVSAVADPFTTTAMAATAAAFASAA
jgi:hypothetical protein